MKPYDKMRPPQGEPYRRCNRLEQSQLAAITSELNDLVSALHDAMMSSDRDLVVDAPTIVWLARGMNIEAANLRSIAQKIIDEGAEVHGDPTPF